MFASDVLSEGELLAFLKNSLSNEKNYGLKDVKLHTTKEIEYPIGWRAYFVTLKFRAAEREIELKDIIFSDNKMISRDFITLKEAKSLKNELLDKWNENIQEDDK
jgi:hypothetical protein